MEVMEQLYNTNDPNYNMIVKKIKDNIINTNDEKAIPAQPAQYMFIDVQDDILQPKPTIKSSTISKKTDISNKVSTNNKQSFKKTITSSPTSYMFIDDTNDT